MIASSSVDGIMKKGLVATLHHWKEVIIQERSVQLDVLDVEVQKSMQELATAIRESPAGRLETIVAMEAVPEEVDLEIPLMNPEENETIPLLFDSTAGPEAQSSFTERSHTMEKEQTNRMPSPPGSISERIPSERHRPGGSTHPDLPSSAQPSIHTTPTHTAKQPREDLYKWLAEEQELHRSRKLTAERSSKGATRGVGGGIEALESESITNDPFDTMIIPISIFFGPLTERYGLAAEKRPMSYHALMGNDYIFMANMDEFAVHLIEPRILRMNNQFKRVTHSERQILTFSNLTTTAYIKYQTPQIASIQRQSRILKAANLPTNESQNFGEAKKASTVQAHANETVSYHSHLTRISCNIGFPSISFLNQVQYIFKAVLDTVFELKKSDCVNALAVDKMAPPATVTLRNVRSASCLHAEAGTISIPKSRSSAAIPRISRSKRSAQRSQPAASGKLRGSRTSSMDTAESTDVMDYTDWSMRFLDMLAHYQRTQSRDRRRNSLEKKLLTLDDALLSVSVFGVFDVGEVRIQATLTELVVLSSITALQFGHSSKERRLLSTRKLQNGETSLTSAFSRANMILSENREPTVQTVFHMNIDHSQVLLTRMQETGRNSLLVEIGPISIDIPLNPGLLHGVVVRSSKTISNTLKELKTPQVIEEIVQVKRAVGEASVGQYSRQFKQMEAIAVVHFSVILRSLNITAALLPSLKVICLSWFLIVFLNFLIAETEINSWNN